MSTKKVFHLAHAEARRRCAEFALKLAPENWRVTFEEPKRKNAQNDKYHAMIDDIAKQTTYAGRRWDAADMKRILVDEFAAEMRAAGKPLHHDGRLIPSEDGRRVIQLGVQTSEFYVKEAAEFIEFLQAWGDMREVAWGDEARMREGAAA
jgi:hypothetical protein